jgi:hypothetical protein
MNTCGKGKYRVWMRREKVGDDLVYLVGGGERPHVGSVVLKEPGKRARVLRLGTHHDHVVLKPIAVAACERHKCTVVAVGGIHVEDASREEVDLLVANCRGLMKCI